MANKAGNSVLHEAVRNRRGPWWRHCSTPTPAAPTTSTSRWSRRCTWPPARASSRSSARYSTSPGRRPARGAGAAPARAQSGARRVPVGLVVASQCRRRRRQLQPPLRLVAGLVAARGRGRPCAPAAGARRVEQLLGGAVPVRDLGASSLSTLATTAWKVRSRPSA